MRGHKTYGKRSKAVYNPIALSSPEQPLPEHAKPRSREETPIKLTELRKRVDKSKNRKQPERKALNERSHNAVVQPLEAVVELVGKRNKGVKPLDSAVSVKEHKTTEATRNFEPIFNHDDDKSCVMVSEPVPTITTQSRDKPTANQRRRHVRGGDDETVSGPNVYKGQIDRTHESCGAAETEIGTYNVFQAHCEKLLDLSPHPLTGFHTWSSQLSEHFTVTKIAEASFAEVFRLSLREQMPGFSSTDESVFKIIPLKPADSTLPLDKRKRAAAMKKSELMSKPEDVANEVKLLQRMSIIPGFTNLRDIRILQGRPPEAFTKAYKAWNAEQKAKKKPLSEFPDPSKKSSYTVDQLWAVIEMQDAGIDLERFVENGECTSIWTVWDTFWQVVLSLAKGEEGAEFEHRDLHLGNICVRATPTSSDREVNSERKLNFVALETTIIDYTISRCLMPNSTTAYTDLSLDPALFEGDSTNEYQYDIYRFMRSVLFLDQALADFPSRAREVEDSGRHWEQYHPQTNLVWLHLVLYKLLEQIAWPSGWKVPNKKTKRADYKQWKRANDLEHVLLRVQDLLSPEQICANGIGSAGDLVLFALQEEWLDVEDVVGHAVGDESALVSQLEGLEL